MGNIEIGGQREQNNPGRGIKLAQVVHQLQALIVVGVAVTEAHVDDGDVKAFVAQEVTRFFAAVGNRDAVALRGEQSAEHLT